MTVDALTHALQGAHVGGGAQVRPMNSVARQLKSERAQGSAPERVRGLVHLRGTLVAPEGVNDAWRRGDETERERIEDMMREGTIKALELQSFAQVVAATSVRVRGEPGAALLELDWIAVAGVREGRVQSACEPNNLTPEHTREAAVVAGASFWQLVEAEREAGTPQQVEPAQDAPALDAAQPSAPAQGVEDLAADRVPLSDSVSRYGRLFGERGAAELRGFGQETRVEQRYRDLSVADLRQGLAELRTFEPLERGEVRTPEQVEAWWLDNGVEAAAVVGAEQELIERAQREHRDRAGRAIERGGTELADPMATVHAARGDQFADQVDWRATVLASHLDGVSPEERQRLSAESRTAIRRSGGVGKADLEDLARATALQYDRNFHNEQEHLARQADATVEAGQQAEVAPQQQQRVIEGAGADRGM